MTDELALLHEKIDHLTAQVEAQRRSQQVWDDLWQDLTPVANQAVKLTIRELSDINGDFTLEDLLHLLKRLLRDAHRFSQLLDRLEATMALMDEAQLLSKPVFVKAIQALDELERKGYFTFAHEGARMLDRIVTEFSEDDARALADNIVTIVSTVRTMTQPEVLALANSAIEGMQAGEVADADASLWALMREMNDPKVRKGLARLMRVVKTLSEQPATVAAN